MPRHLADRLIEAIAAGHDGLILRNVQAPFDGTVYVAASTEQIAQESEPPTLDEKPAKVCSDEIGLEEIIQFDLKPLGDPDDDIDEISLPKSLAPVFGVSSDGQLTIHRRHSSGLVLTADETRSLYQFLGDSVRIWGAAL